MRRAHERIVSNFISPRTIKKIAALVESGHSARSIARGLGLSKDTAAKYVRKLGGLCPCGKSRGHRGWCGDRYLKSQVHKEVLAKANSDYIEPPRALPLPPKRDIREKYPYCLGPPSEGNALLRAVSDAVSKTIPDHDRGDICQDLIVMILEKEIDVSDLVKVIEPVRKRHNAMFAQHVMSIDMPVADGIALSEGLSETIWDAVPYGSSGTLRKRAIAPNP